MRGLGCGLRVHFVGLAVVSMTAGCAIERPGVSASSLNPSPWFNFQLAPAKKDNPSYQRNIARNSADRVTVKPAISTPIKEVHWPELKLPSFRREAQTLPRTDDVPRESPSIGRTAQSDDINFD